MTMADLARIEKRQAQQEFRITVMLAVLGVSLAVIGLFVTPLDQVLNGLWTIITSSSILITDYVALANLGAALVNAGLVTLIGLMFARVIRAKFSGYLISAIFTMAGFAFFGKNVLNIWPIFAGVYVYSRLAQKPMKDLLAPALFGTTLSPIVSEIAFGENFVFLDVFQVPLGMLAGVGAGILLAALMKHVFSLHLGYNLYNTGTTGGFVATVFYIMLRGFGITIEPAFYWSDDPMITLFLTGLTVVVCALLIIFGFRWDGSVKGYQKIIAKTGKLSNDFVDIADLGSTMINMGLIGLMGLGYIAIVKGDVNGAMMAGLFTVIGFGGLGKHPSNIAPIMLGVLLADALNIWTSNDPGPLLAALFSTTLAPFAGEFGFFAGLFAGALHLPMVMHVGSIHGFMNLYNNGFAGGLAMLIVIGFIKGLKPELLDRETPW